MGDSHFRSNLIGKDGDEYIASLDYVKLTSGEKLAEAHLKLGTYTYMVWGTATQAAAMETAVTAYTTASPYPGSVYVSLAASSAARGGGWYVRGRNAASWTNIVRH